MYTGSKAHLEQIKQLSRESHAIKISCIHCRGKYGKPGFNRHEKACHLNPINLHPCVKCHKLTHKPKFCGESCAAIYNNTHRKHSNETKQKMSQAAKLTPRIIKSNNQKIERILKNGFKDNRDARLNLKYIASGPYTRILLKTCRISGKTFFTKNPAACAHPSVSENKNYYDDACKFKHNVFLYPDEYELDLITNHGFYNNKKNPQGAARDHMYSISEGFKNSIPVEIMKHPANCEVMLQRDNTKKRTRCSITIEELYERIAIWDEKYST
jgi:hypothetical protein